MGEGASSAQSDTYFTKGFLLVDGCHHEGISDFSRYEEMKGLDNYLKTRSPVSLEDRVPHSPAWIPLKGCWRSAAAPAQGSVVTVQISCSVVSDSLKPRGLQRVRLPCPSTTPGACSNSCLLSQWYHPTISSSVIPFSCLQSFPASGSSPRNQFFTSGDQSIGISLQHQSFQWIFSTDFL